MGFTWLHAGPNGQSRPSKWGKSLAQRKRSRPRRLLLEALEDRTLLSFASPVAYEDRTSPGGIAVGDFNNDGILDIVTANADSANVGVLLGNGNGTFQPPIYSTIFNGHPVSIAVGDFRHVGKLDVAVAMYDGGGVSVLLGNGDGTFQFNAHYLTGAFPFSVAVGDFNGDGYLDLAVANYNNGGIGTVSVLLNKGDGTGTFLPAVNYFTGALGPTSVAVGDFTGNGKLDLALASPGSNTVSVLLNNGDGTFQFPINFGVLTNPYSVAVGDFTGNGKLDLVTANAGSNDVSVLLGNGDGTFHYAPSSPVGVRDLYVATGDFRHVGKLDVVTANPFNSTVSVLLGNGNGTFQAPMNYDAGSNPVGVAVGDFTGNGFPDLAVSNSLPSSVSVLLNQADWGSAPPPSTQPTPESRIPVEANSDHNQAVDRVLAEDLALLCHLAPVPMTRESEALMLQNTSANGNRPDHWDWIDPADLFPRPFPLLSDSI